MERNKQQRRDAVTQRRYKRRRSVEEGETAMEKNEQQRRDAVSQRRYKQRRSVDEGETAGEKNGQQKKRRGVATASQTEEECR